MLCFDIEDDIMDPSDAMHNPYTAIRVSSQKKTCLSLILRFELETLSRSIPEFLITGLDDGVAASFQRSRIHKPHAHTQAFKVNHSTSR
ncbi:hypothetical protein Tco_0128270 [Tanacetum coccineum]